MTAEEIKKKVEQKLGRKVKVSRGALDKQYFILVHDSKDIKDVMKYVFSELGARLNTMTGIDARDYVEILYHMSFDKYGVIFTVKTRAMKPFPSIDSVSDIVTGAKWIEREVYELYDVKFKGHPELIPLLRSDTRPPDYFPFQREVKEDHLTIRMKDKGIKEK